MIITYYKNMDPVENLADANLVKVMHINNDLEILQVTDKLSKYLPKQINGFHMQLEDIPELGLYERESS